MKTDMKQKITSSLKDAYFTVSLMAFGGFIESAVDCGRWLFVLILLVNFIISSFVLTTNPIEDID